MRNPDFPTADVVAWFLEDMRFELRPSTWRSHRSRAKALAARYPTLRELVPENADRFIRDSASQHSAMNKAILVKKLGRYMAEKRIWYAEGGVSVFIGVKQPRPLPHGQAPYNGDEIRAILRAVTDGRHAARNRAVVMVLLQGLRANEARCLQKRNIVFPIHRESGHVIIETDAKTSSSNRPVPLDPAAVEPIREYIRTCRPRFCGEGVETLFLTDGGEQFSFSGWHAMMQRLRRLAAHEGIPLRGHRLRSTSVRLAHEQGWPDSVNIAAHGWSARTGQQMLARYRGPIPVEQMKRYPPRLAGVLRAS